MRIIALSRLARPFLSVWSLAALALAIGLSAVPARAQEPQLLGQDKDWAAFTVSVDGGKNCFVVSQPKTMEPKNVNRDPVYFFVTMRPKDSIQNQVSVVTGYPYQNGSKTSIEIGSERFVLFTRDDKAWIEDVAKQDELVAAMRRGSSMVVRGTSSRGTNTVDTYSLFGVTAALKRADDACKS